MKLRLLSVFILASQIALSVPPETKEMPMVATPAAPIVSIMFASESSSFERVFTLVQSGDYFGNKNSGVYYPQILSPNNKIERNTFIFDSGALLQGPNVYPFMFTHKGEFYYLVFATSRLLEEKSEFPFFASIVKVAEVDEKTNSAQIDTVANLYFKQNDTLALILKKDNFEFYNVTQKTKAGFVKGAGQSQSLVKLTPKVLPKRRKVSLKPLTSPKPVRSVAQPANAAPVRPLLKPIKSPAPAQVR